MNLPAKRKKRKYSSDKNAMLCMVKIGGDQRKGEPMIIKWLFTRNLLKFGGIGGMLDTKYPTWRFFNVHHPATKLQVDNYTRNKRPTTIYPPNWQNVKDILK